MTKRVFLILAFLATLTVAAVPWFTGRHAQERYEQTLADLERHGMQVLESRYRRGWLVSEAETDLSLAAGALAQGGGDWRLRASSQITHGPLSWGDLLQGRIQPMAARAETRLALTPGSGESQPLGPILSTRVDFDGNTQLLLHSGEDGRSHGEGVAFRVDEIEGEIRIDARGNRIQADIQVPLLVLSENGFSRLRVRNLAVIADTASSASGLRLGRATLALDEAHFADPYGDGSVLLRGLDVEVDSGAEGESVWAAATCRCKEMRSDDERLAVSEIKVRADGLSAPVLARLDRSLSDLVRSDAPGQYQSFALMAVLSANLNKLLLGDPQVRVERLHLATEDGAIDGRLRLGVSGWQAAYILNPGRWLDVLDGDAELAIPEALLRRMVAANIRRQLARDSTLSPSSSELQAPRIAAEVQSHIDRLLRQEFAVRDGERISTRARISAGLLTVNGKTVPLATGSVF